jgi:hypothetical protein
MGGERGARRRCDDTYGRLRITQRRVHQLIQSEHAPQPDGGPATAGPPSASPRGVARLFLGTEGGGLVGAARANRPLEQCGYLPFAPTQRFLAVARDVSKLARLYEVGFLAGLRLGELTGLQLDDIVIAASGTRKLRVERQLGQHTSMRDPEATLPKGGKTRQVDAGARLCSILAGLSDDRKSLAMAKGWRPLPARAFVTRNGTPFNQRFIEQDFPARLREGRTTRSPHAALDAAYVRLPPHRPRLQPEVASAADGALLDQRHPRHLREVVEPRRSRSRRRPRRAGWQRRGSEGPLTALQPRERAGKYAAFLLRAHSSVG